MQHRHDMGICLKRRPLAFCKQALPTHSCRWRAVPNRAMVDAGTASPHGVRCALTPGGATWHVTTRRLASRRHARMAPGRAPAALGISTGLCTLMDWNPTSRVPFCVAKLHQTLESPQHSHSGCDGSRKTPCYQIVMKIQVPVSSQSSRGVCLGGGRHARRPSFNQVRVLCCILIVTPASGAHY
jgi:hypothetical protein